MSRTLFCNSCGKVVAIIENHSKLIKGLVCYCEECNKKLEQKADAFMVMAKYDSTYSSHKYD